MDQPHQKRIIHLEIKIASLYKKIKLLQSSNNLIEKNVETIENTIKNIQIPEKKIIQSITTIENSLFLLQQL